MASGPSLLVVKELVNTNIFFFVLCFKKKKKKKDRNFSDVIWVPPRLKV